MKHRGYFQGKANKSGDGWEMQANLRESDGVDSKIKGSLVLLPQSRRIRGSRLKFLGYYSSASTGFTIWSPISGIVTDSSCYIDEPGKISGSFEGLLND